MGAKRDVVHGNLAGDGVALHSDYLFWFIHDFLFVRSYQRSSRNVAFMTDVEASEFTRDGRGRKDVH
jgi:hypothetical protein